MTNEEERPESGSRRDRAKCTGDWDRIAAEGSDGAAKEALVNESDRLMSAVDEIKRLESEKRRLPMSTPEFHRTASRIEKLARQVFGISKAQREIGEALQTGHDESIEDAAVHRSEVDRESSTGVEPGS